MATEQKPEAQKPARKPRQPKMLHEVRQAGSTITLQGIDVKLKGMTPTQRAEHKVKEISGKLDTPCAEPVVIKFASPVAAKKFFDLNFLSAENVFIVDGAKTEWSSEHIDELASKIVDGEAGTVDSTEPTEDDESDDA